MATPPRFNVISTGKIINGFDADEVQGHLLTRLRLKPEQAAQFFGRPRVLKKDLSQAQAEKFCQGLAALGIEVKSVALSPPKPEPLRLEPEPEIPPLHSNDTLSLVDDEPSASRSRDSIECPNCGHVQAKSEQCESCGIFFHKWEATTSATRPHNPTQTATGLQAPASIAKPPGAATPSRKKAAEKGFNAVALVAAFVAALFGAWVWQFVAVNYGYEFAFIAWGIGGAVGFGAAMFGSHGTQSGIICGLLVVGSIALGKVWFYNTLLDQFRESSMEIVDDDSELRAVYDETVEDARLLAELDSSDDALRRYMVERGYTDATQPSRVRRQELEDFREFYEPDLRNFAAREPSYNEWQAGADFSLDGVSAWQMIREDFSVIDLVFLFLGVGTAFRLASQMD